MSLRRERSGFCVFAMPRLSLTTFDLEFQVHSFLASKTGPDFRTMEVFHGLRHPTKVVANQPIPSMTESPSTAERLRTVYKLIISPARDGGAGITPQAKDWELVESILPLRDSKFDMVEPS